jgi:hypothetical protein
MITAYEKVVACNTFGPNMNKTNPPRRRIFKNYFSYGKIQRNASKKRLETSRAQGLIMSSIEMVTNCVTNNSLCTDSSFRRDSGLISDNGQHSIASYSPRQT